MNQRDQRSHNLARLFAPRSIAVVGASANSEKAGYQALKALDTFEGEIWPVNPQGGAILGRKVYTQVKNLPAPADLVILAVPSQASVQAFSEVASTGCGGALIISGGFAETGNEGATRQSALSDVIQKSPTRLLGPNTSGFINPYVGCRASFVPGLEKVRAGNVAVVAQSGGVNLALTFQLHNMGLGVSLAVGLGNAVDVGAVDVLDYLTNDHVTKAIVVHFEGIENGRVLYDAIKRLTPIKPVVALVAGRTDVGEFAQSHTGKILGSFERKTAMLRQAGAIVVETTDDAADAAAALSMIRLRPASAPKLAVVTGQAGPGLLIADALNQAGAELAAFTQETRSKLAELLPPMTDSVEEVRQ